MNRIVAWATLALVTAVTVGFIALLQVTSCADAAPGLGESSCTTGPAVGVPALWSIVAVGAAVVGVAVWRVVRIVRTPNDEVLRGTVALERGRRERARFRQE